MSAESPAEYVKELREQNKILRANVVQLVQEKHVLEVDIARLVCRIEKMRRENDQRVEQLRRESGRKPHDYEPARISDVD